MVLWILGFASRSIFIDVILGKNISLFNSICFLNSCCFSWLRSVERSCWFRQILLFPCAVVPLFVLFFAGGPHHHHQCVYLIPGMICYQCWIIMSYCVLLGILFSFTWCFWTFAWCEFYFVSFIFPWFPRDFLSGLSRIFCIPCKPFGQFLLAFVFVFWSSHWCTFC